MATRRRHTIYRCASKACGRVVRLALDVETRASYRGPTGQLIPALVLSVRVASPVPEGIRLDPRGATSDPALVCSCPRGLTGEVMRSATVVGRVTSQPCGARCLASTGPTCECACGGANHGKNHGG